MTNTEVDEDTLPGIKKLTDIEDTDEFAKLDLRAFAWGFLCFHRARGILTWDREGALVSRAQILEAVRSIDRVKRTDLPPSFDEFFHNIRRLGRQLQTDESLGKEFVAEVLDIAALIDRLVDEFD